MDAKGLNAKELSIRAGLDESIVSKIFRKPEAKPQVDTIMALARALEISVDELMTGLVQPLRKPTLVPVYGEVAAGIWREEDVWDEAKYAPVPVVPSRYPGLEQRAWHVSGDSMDKAGIVEGAFIITVDYWSVRNAPLDGDIVVVEQRRAGLVQRTCKEVRTFPGRVELHPRSTNPKWEPIVLPAGNQNADDGKEVEIVGLVIWSAMPIGRF